jgi:DNA-binding beta-propeller fold protein YncE
MRRVSPRVALSLIAGALALVLIVLIGYLWWLYRPADLTQRGGKPIEGLIPEFSMYGPGRGELATFSNPMGAAWSEDGRRIYVADTDNNRIVVFDDKGRYLSEFGGFGIAKPLPGAQPTWDPGELNYPTDVAVGDDGSVYVADFYNDSISAFDAEGKFVRRFPDPNARAGRGGSGQGGLGIAVTAVAVSGDRVYATDQYQVFVFSSRGELLDQFGLPGVGPRGLDHPCGIVADRDGNVVVADSNHNRVVRYTAEGVPVWVTGRPVNDLKAESKNPFVLPRGIALKLDGGLIVADPLAQQLVELDRDGRVVRTLGARGTAPGQLNFPSDVDLHGEQLLVADRENNRVQVVRQAEQ